jgi:NAD(P)-dependent dehydrogenase (short-subunit alcohol dehydrogenase family)
MRLEQQSSFIRGCDRSDEMADKERRLANKRVLVTGAGTGIGRQIALEFALQGADVVLHYSHEPAGAESALKEIESMGRRAAIVLADFNDDNAADKLANTALEFLGQVDCLVNNAGITFNSPFLKVKSEQFDVLMNVNFRTPFFLTQRIVADMIQHGGGAICNLSSIHGLQGAPEHSAYAATKGAIIASTRALAVEFGHKGVRVNAIAPGWITVESYWGAIPGFSLDMATEQAQNSIPIARYGVPSDVAKLAAFLCSDDAGFITAQTFVIDGGTTALMSLISDFRNESKARFGREYLPDRQSTK